jgi:hypothetical protein
MLHIEKMTKNDYSFAVQITNTLNWNMTISDFEFMAAIEPTECFVLYNNLEKLGVVTCVIFDKIGWVGNFILKQRFRYQGAGSFFLKKTLMSLKDKGVQTIGLFSYLNLIDFYKRFEFKKDEEIITFQGQISAFNMKISEIREARNEVFSKILDFDNSHIGFNRSKSLNLLFSKKSNVVYYSIQNDAIQGYVLVKTYNELVEIGPLVVRSMNEFDGIDLLIKAFSKLSGYNILIYIPKKYKKIIKFISMLGLKKKSNLVRMFLGPSLNMDGIYLPESLERG